MISPQALWRANSQGGLPGIGELPQWLATFSDGHVCVARRTAASARQGRPHAGRSPALQVSVLRLAPGVTLAPHEGVTNARLTMHLGLAAPAEARIRVGDAEVGWQRGRVLLFDDSWEHTAWNAGSEPRYVLHSHAWHPLLAGLVHAPADDGWADEEDGAAPPRQEL